MRPLFQTNYYMNSRKPYKKTILLSLWCIFLLISCHPDREDVTLVNTYIPSPEIVEPFSGNLQVYVSDVSNQPLEGVEVYIYDEKQISNAFGLVQFTNIQLDKNGTYVRALKDDYLFGSDKFFPAGKDNYTVIRMFPLEGLKTFQSTDAVTIAVEGGGSIDFPANSFELEQGGAYQGEVRVFAQRIATDDNDLIDIMPGALLAEDKEGKTQVLGTYGMIAVELYGTDDVPLQLVSGKVATINFPITESLEVNAPESIPLWYFDEISGLWREEGVAIKLDKAYIGEVSHFSFWNCDAPFDLISMEGRVVNNQEEGVAYAQIGIYSSLAGVAFGYTDVDGYFAGKVPKGELLTIKVFIQGCPDAVYEAEIGGFDNNVILDDIVLSSDIQTIGGYVTCLGLIEPDSEIVITTATNSYLIPTNEDGFFSFQLAESICDQEQVIEVRAIRISDNSASPVQEVALNDASNLTFEVCADCDFSVGLFTEFSSPCETEAIVNSTIENGSGSYIYEWSNGLTESTITVSTNGQYCLTVTDDLTDCEVISCTDVDVISEPISAEYTTQGISCFDNGLIVLNVSGGTPDYSFVWTGPNGFASTEQNLIGLSEIGIYACTITDVNGCIYEFEVELMEEFFTYEITILTSNNSNVICGDEIMQLEAICNNCSGQPEFFWTIPNGNSSNDQVITAIEAGLYSVELVAGNCLGFGEIEILQTEFPGPVIEVICDVDGYYFEVSGINPEHTVDVPEILTSELIMSFNSMVDQTILVQSQYQECFRVYDVQLPYAEGNPITNISEPTCGGCSDGYVEYDLDLVNGINTTVGSVAIYLEGDFESNLFDVNEAQMLPVGVYFFVILSEEGCVIYSEIVDI